MNALSNTSISIYLIQIQIIGNYPRSDDLTKIFRMQINEVTVGKIQPFVTATPISEREIS